MTELGVGILMLAGLAGTLLPVLPGPLIMWLAAIAYGLATGFGPGGIIAMVAITAALAWGAWLSIRIPQRRAAGSGLGVGAQLLAAALAVAGFFLIPVVGAPAGFVAGIFLTRYLDARDIGTAWEATKEGLGSLWRAAAAQFGAGLIAFAVWVVWAIAG